MKNAILQELSAAGVSVWLDDLSRDRLVGGGLARLVDELSVVEGAASVIAELAEHGIDLDAVTAALEAEGVAKFQQSWEDLLSTLSTTLAAVR